MKIKLILLTLVVLAVAIGIPLSVPSISFINIIAPVAAVILAVGGIYVITQPLEQLKDLSNEIAKGNLNIKSSISNSHELGGIAEQLDNTAMLLMNKIEDQKTFNQRIEEQKKELETTTEEIHYINKQITASINYAERIQRSMLPDQKMLKGIFKESFIIYMPKDVVSGDFYWFERINRAGKEYMVVAAADCTGHGVPGAIMSMMGNNLLTNIVYYQNYLDPNKILARMDQEIKYELKQGENPEDSKDGMEMALCVIDLDTNELDYAGGGIPLYIMRDGELITYKPDKVMLGGMVGQSEDDNLLNVHHIQLQKNDKLYLCSDGFQDQFGGPQDKKFMAKRLRELFKEIHEASMEEQNQVIAQRFEDWKKDTDQTDDVMVLGFRI